MGVAKSLKKKKKKKKILFAIPVRLKQVSPSRHGASTEKTSFPRPPAASPVRQLRLQSKNYRYMKKKKQNQHVRLFVT